MDWNYFLVNDFNWSNILRKLHIYQLHTNQQITQPAGTIGRISSCYTCGQRGLQGACSGGTRPGRWRRGRGWRPSVVAESSHRKTLLQGRTLQNQIIQSLISRALTWGVTTLKNTWGLTLVDLLWSRENITCAWLGVGPLPGVQSSITG